MRVKRYLSPSVAGSILDTVKSPSMQNMFKPIFNSSRSGGDRKRKQVVLKEGSRLSSLIQRKTVSLLKREKAWHPSMRAKEVTILKSEPGCEKQKRHFDFPVSDPPCLSKGVLFSLQKGTTFLTYSSVSGRERRHKLEMGDAFVFDGGTEHAGDSFQDENYRIHVYVDSSLDSSKREKGRTYFRSKI